MSSSSDSDHDGSKGILDIIMNAVNVAKSQESRIPQDINLIKGVVKTALNNGETNPKDLLVRFCACHTSR